MLTLILALAAAHLPRPITAAEKTAVMLAVKEKLKDPSSAQWQWYRVAAKGVYCGRVNAKNTFGGYSGFQIFQVFYNAQLNHPDAAVIGESESSGALAEALTKVCRENGYEVNHAP